MENEKHAYSKSFARVGKVHVEPHPKSRLSEMEHYIR